MRTEKLLAAIAVPVILAVSAAHAAQPAYPEKPIRLVIGSAPGSGPDIIARVVADRLWKAWGQPVVVDARPGVAGILSAELVSRTTPDGYTWMMLTSQLLVATSLYLNLKFNLGKDFASISLIGTVPFVLVVNRQVQAKSIAELIEVAKKDAGSAPLWLGRRRRLRAFLWIHVHAFDGHRHAACALQGHRSGPH